MANVVVFSRKDLKKSKALATVDILRRQDTQCNNSRTGSEVITGGHHIPVKMDDVLDTFYWADIDALVLTRWSLQEPLIYEMMNFLLRN